MYGGGDTGDEYVAVTSTGIVLLTCDFVATSARLTDVLPSLWLPVSSGFIINTSLPSKSTSFTSHSSSCAPIFMIFSRSAIAALRVAIPVTYVVDDAYEPESYGDASVSAPNTAI